MLYLVAMWSSGWEMPGLGSQGEDLLNNISCSCVCAVAIFQSAGMRINLVPIEAIHSIETFPCHCAQSKQQHTRAVSLVLFPSPMSTSNIGVDSWHTNCRKYSLVYVCCSVPSIFVCSVYEANDATPALCSSIPWKFKIEIESNGCSFSPIHFYKCQSPSLLHTPLMILQLIFCW